MQTKIWITIEYTYATAFINSFTDICSSKILNYKRDFTTYPICFFCFQAYRPFHSSCSVPFSWKTESAISGGFFMFILSLFQWCHWLCTLSGFNVYLACRWLLLHLLEDFISMLPSIYQFLTYIWLLLNKLCDFLIFIVVHCSFCVFDGFFFVSQLLSMYHVLHSSDSWLNKARRFKHSNYHCYLIVMQESYQ